MVWLCAEHPQSATAGSHCHRMGHARLDGWMSRQSINPLCNPSTRTNRHTGSGASLQQQCCLQSHRRPSPQGVCPTTVLLNLPESEKALFYWPHIATHMTATGMKSRWESSPQGCCYTHQYTHSRSSPTTHTQCTPKNQRTTTAATIKAAQALCGRTCLCSNSCPT